MPKFAGTWYGTALRMSPMGPGSALWSSSWLAGTIVPERLPHPGGTTTMAKAAEAGAAASPLLSRSPAAAARIRDRRRGTCVIFMVASLYSYRPGRADRYRMAPCPITSRLADGPWRYVQGSLNRLVSDR